MNIAVFSCDPGGATGLAWGIFDPTADIGVALRGRLHSGNTTVSGSIPEQIREISAVWQSFYGLSIENAKLPPERVWYVCENFIFTGANYGGDSAVISTALIWGVEGYRMGCADEWGRANKKEAHLPPVILQRAGDVSGYATDARLRQWDCWIKGRDHERSAWRHIAYFLKKYQSQGLS